MDYSSIKKKLFDKPGTSMDDQYSDELSIIVKFYCNFGHLLGMCPFWLSKDRNSEKFKISTFRPQKVFSMITTLIMLLHTLGSTRSDWKFLTGKTKHPFHCFYGGFSLCHFVLKLLCLKLMWFGSHRFLNLINFIANPKNKLPPIPSRIALKIKVVLLSVVSAMVGGGLAYDVVMAREVSITNYIHHYYLIGRHHFFFDDFDLRNRYSNETNFFKSLRVDQAWPLDRDLLAWFTIITGVYRYNYEYRNELNRNE